VYKSITAVGHRMKTIISTVVFDQRDFYLMYSRTC